MRTATQLTLLLSSFAAATGYAADAPTTRPATRPSLHIVIDTTAAPAMAPFAAKAAAAGVAYYDTIAALLPGDPYVPPHKAWLTFKKDPQPYVAYTVGDHIFCDPDYYAKRPNDVGSIIHELTHVVQAYRLRQPPSWVTEGIADWVRWFHYEPANKRPRPHGDDAKYNASYQTSAAFLQWATLTYDKKLVMKLNAACRAGHYRPSLWVALTGKTIEQLGAEWKQAVADPRPTTQPG